MKLTKPEQFAAQDGPRQGEIQKISTATREINSPDPSSGAARFRIGARRRAVSAPNAVIFGIIAKLNPNFLKSPARTTDRDS
jgi:hypothetical protein